MNPYLNFLKNLSIPIAIYTIATLLAVVFGKVYELASLAETSRVYPTSQCVYEDGNPDGQPCWFQQHVVDSSEYLNTL